MDNDKTDFPFLKSFFLFDWRSFASELRIFVEIPFFGCHEYTFEAEARTHTHEHMNGIEFTKRIGRTRM